MAVISHHHNIMRKRTIFFIVSLCAFYTLPAQVVNDLFTTRDHALSKGYHTLARNYQALEINPGKLASLRNEAPSVLNIELPFDDKKIVLRLKKVRITSDDFSVVEVLPGGQRRTVQYSDAVFYQGKIEGKSSSFATISLAGEQVMGIIADEQGNIILGAIEEMEKPTHEYVLYRESDLEITNSQQNCFTPDDIITDSIPAIRSTTSQERLTTVGAPVEIYFECDNKLYHDKGNSTTNVINYVLGVFNNTALLYGNENIKIQVSQILVWTIPDPEATAGLNSSNAVLTAFSSRMATTPYTGDYAHFLSTRALGGGVAWISNPCPDKYYRSSVSAINTTYSNFPTYSWTVMVVTHELGHNLGSRHTHWCGWPGGPIDGCAPIANITYTEGACAPGPLPVSGSLMSYCHLLGGIGINFNNGFGPLPGQAIRDFITASSCLATCQMTIELTKQDASCGQYNGTATVTASNATGALSYLWSNGQTGATLVNAASGTYHVTVTDAAGCKVTDDITIANGGTILTFAMNTGSTAGFCAGGSITLSTTASPSYVYQWRRNGSIINGAISSSYTATTAGTYALTIFSGACQGTQSVQVTELAPPTATITSGGIASFCEGGSILLNADIGSLYTYQWYKNGVAETGATAPAYSATTSGNYAVKVSAGNNCEATSALFAVTVRDSPVAGVTASGATSFCSGNSVILLANDANDYSHQWYRNDVLINGSTQSLYEATISGRYTVKTSIGNCSQTSAGVEVNVLPLPVVTVTPAFSIIEKFQSQTLTASGASSYNWANLPARVNHTVNSGVYRPLITTIYPVEGTGDNGCKTVINATVVVSGCGVVANITSVIYSPSRVFLRWSNPPDVTGDSIQYRKSGSPVWNRVYTTGEACELNGLEPGTEYEFNILPLCTTTNIYIPSATKNLKTPGLENDLYLRLFPNPVINTSRLEVISAGDFSFAATVHDNTGKLIMTINPAENFPAGQVIRQVNTHKLANGIYHIAVTINGKKHDIKMIVSR